MGSALSRVRNRRYRREKKTIEKEDPIESLVPKCMETSPWNHITPEDVTSLEQEEMVTSQAIFLILFSKIVSSGSTDTDVVHLEYSNEYFEYRQGNRAEQPKISDYTFGKSQKHFGSKAKKIILPIYHDGHYFGILLERVESKYRVEIVDSIGVNLKLMRKLIELVEAVIEEHEHSAPHFICFDKIHRQTDMNSCGIHLLHNLCGYMELGFNFFNEKQMHFSVLAQRAKFSDRLKKIREIGLIIFDEYDGNNGEGGYFQTNNEMVIEIGDDEVGSCDDGQSYSDSETENSNETSAEEAILHDYSETCSEYGNNNNA